MFCELNRPGVLLRSRGSCRHRHLIIGCQNAVPFLVTYVVLQSIDRLLKILSADVVAQRLGRHAIKGDRKPTFGENLGYLFKFKLKLF